MKDNKLYIAIIFALVVFGLIWAGNLYVDLRNNKSQSSQSVPCPDCYENQYRIIPGIESDNLFLNLERDLISYDKNIGTLKTVLHPDSMYLILKYRLSYCGECVTEILTALEQLKDSIPCINIVVITCGGSLRDMKVKMHPYKDIFPIYEMMLANDMGLPLDSSNIPYMVFVDDAKTSKHTLVVDANSIDLLQAYIRVLSRKYCE